METARIERLTQKQLRQTSVDDVCADLMVHVKKSMGLDDGEITKNYDLIDRMEDLDLADLAFYVSQRFGIREQEVEISWRKIRENRTSYTIINAAQDIYDRIK